MVPSNEKTEQSKQNEVALNNDDAANLILDTNPAETHRLWSMVTETMAEFANAESQASKKSRASNAMGTLLYELAILSERRVKIAADIENTIIQDAWSYFGTTRPTPSLADEREAYRTIPGLEDTSIWLRTHDLEKIAEVREEWSALREYRLNEAEHEVKAYELLLPAERRRSGCLPKRQITVPERMIKLKIKPDPDRVWKPPPILQDSKHTISSECSFDTIPDCMYWLSLQSFPPEYQQRIKRHVHVAQRRVLCPYFTIEHKPDDTDAGKARHQIVSAAAMVLFNRYSLRKKRIEKFGSKWTAKDMVLKHFGLHIMGVEYGFWVIEADILPDGTWNGCTMKLLVEGALDIDSEIRTFSAWVNEVHRWGLTEYAPDVHADLNVCIEPEQPLQVLGKRIEGYSDERSPSKQQKPN